MTSVRARALPPGFAYAITRREVLAFAAQSAWPVSHVNFSGTSPSLRHRERGSETPGAWVASIGVVPVQEADGESRCTVTVSLFGLKLDGLAVPRESLSDQLLERMREWLNEQIEGARSGAKLAVRSMWLGVDVHEGTGRFTVHVRRE